MDGSTFCQTVEVSDFNQLISISLKFLFSGFLGLLMGGSFLSLVEIFYHCLLKKCFEANKTSNVASKIFARWTVPVQKQRLCRSTRVRKMKLFRKRSRKIEFEKKLFRDNQAIHCGKIQSCQPILRVELNPWETMV